MNANILRRSAVALLACLFLAPVAWGARPSDRNPNPPQVSNRPDGVRVQVGPDWVSPPVAGEPIFIDPRNRPRLPEWRPGDPIRIIPRLYHGDPRVIAPSKPPVNPVLPGLDPLAELQRAIGSTRGTSSFTTPVVNVAGMANTGVAPSDVNGDIGTTHFIQSINGSGGAQYSIFDKTTGALVAGPFNMDGLGSGGNCGTGGGDPIILFDELANRWMISEFTGNNSSDLCIYISALEDPSLPQTWTRYVFAPAASFPDYPHYGIMPDAYYVGTNQGTTTRPVCAMNRPAMLLGQPATMTCFFPNRLSGFGFQILQPADHDGAAPPVGAPGIFMRHRDDEVHNTGSNNPTQDFVEYFEFRTNFVTPAMASLTGPISVPIGEFSSDLNGLTAFEAFPQPNGQLLDPLREPVMFRLAYRNFATHETLLGNFVTDVDGNDTGGIRWFELRRVGGVANPWTLFQEGTYSLADAGGTIDRWMGGIAMDESGNIALGYSVVRDSPSVFPGLRYVGRLDGDPAGVMTTAETTLIAGGGSQTNERWGDYFSMGIDPSDGCTFWFTGQYIPTNVWQTRIGAFRHDACGTPTFALSGAPLQQSVCAVGPSTALTPVAIDVAARNGFTGQVAMSFGTALPTGFSGSYTTTPVTVPGSTSANLSVDAGTASIGTNFVTLRGSSGGEDKDLSLQVDVATIAAAAPALVAPADAATGVAYTPTLSWNAVAQATSYIVEVSPNAGFTTIAYTATVTGTNHVVATALAPNTTFFWRVRATNACGNANSAVRSFTTLTAPDQCPGGTFAVQTFLDNIENGTNGWTTIPSTGSANRRWTIQTTRPSSPVSSWKSGYPSSGSFIADETLTSPSITIPASTTATTLQFQHYRDIEEDGANACFDGGRLEVSVNGGVFTPVPANQILVDPYYGTITSGSQNPLAGEQAWCGLIPYTKAVVDLQPYAGNPVRLRYHFATDESVSYEGWYVDDVLVQSCLPPGPNVSTTTLTSAPDPSVFGQSVMLTAMVSGGAGTPTGTVTFFDGAVNLGTATLATGSASISIATLSVGTHNLTASYSGNPTYMASTDDDTQVVNRADTTLTIADSPDPSMTGANVTVTATLTANLPGAGTPTGTITVTGTNTSGCAIVRPATSCVLTFTTPGAQTIDASYGGDASFNPATAPQITNTVANANPTVSNPGTQTILEDAQTGVLAVTVGDAETAAAALQLTATSSNTTLVPNANIALGGAGASRTVQVTPVANGFGTTTITLTVTDADTGTGTAVFDVVVTAVNDEPGFTVAGNQSHPAGTTGVQTVPNFVTSVDFGPGEGTQAVLDYVVTQTGGPAGAVTAIDIAANGTLTYTVNGSGTITFDATLQDNGGIADGGDDTSDPVSFSITIADGADLSIAKSNGLSYVVFGQPVSYTIDVANAGPLAITGGRVVDTVPAELTGATWTCTATPPANCANASGSGSIDEALSLGSGESLRYVLTGTVGGTVGGSLVNTAVVNAPVGTPDPNPANNTSTDTDEIRAVGIFLDGFEN